MVAITAIKPGDTLYSVTRGKMGNTSVTTTRVHHVTVEDVDVAGQRARVRWNGNEAAWWSARRLKSLRRSKPEMERSVTGAIRIKRAKRGAQK